MTLKRKVESASIILGSIILALFIFSMDNVTITGMVVKEIQVEDKGYIISGTEFKALIGQATYYYLFTDDNEWYETKDGIDWEKREDMGNTLWKGIVYLKTYNARIYFDDSEITDITEFARNFR